MKIHSYKFGEIKVEDKLFNKDIIISKNEIFPNWWRQDGHKLNWQDISNTINQIKPEILILGTGKHGILTVQKEVKENLKQLNIKLISLKTDDAVKEYNRLYKDKNILGAFHLTC